MVIALAGDLRGTFDAYVEAERAKERSKTVLILNENTMARFAMHEVEKDSLRQAVDAADALNGELVAALAIRIAPDTVFVEPDDVFTQFDTTSAGVTRTAFLSDTTDAGIEVTVNAVAPPEPAPLQVGYTLVFPETRPEIAFIETSEGVFASVSWLNREFTVEAPFFRPIPINPKPLRINAGARALLHSDQIMSLTAFAELAYRFDNKWTVSTPFGVDNHGTFLGVQMMKTIGEWDGVLDMLWPF